MFLNPLHALEILFPPWTIWQTDWSLLLPVPIPLPNLSCVICTKSIWEMLRSIIIWWHDPLEKTRNLCYSIFLYNFQHILQRKYTSIRLFISILFFRHHLAELKAPLFFAASPVENIQTYHQCFPTAQVVKLDPVKILFALQLMSIKVLYRQS